MLNFRWLIAATLLCLTVPALAQQSATISFDPPSTGGAPTGYRLYRDGTLVSAVTSGQTLTNLFPSNAGSWVIGVEAFNATGPGPRVNQTVTIGPVAPGPVRNVQINCPVPVVTPATVTCSVTAAP